MGPPWGVHPTNLSENCALTVSFGTNRAPQLSTVPARGAACQRLCEVKTPVILDQNLWKSASRRLFGKIVESILKDFGFSYVL
jgi:hypothetical protein